MKFEKQTIEVYTDGSSMWSDPGGLSCIGCWDESLKRVKIAPLKSLKKLKEMGFSAEEIIELIEAKVV